MKVIINGRDGITREIEETEFHALSVSGRELDPTTMSVVPVNLTSASPANVDIASLKQEIK